MAERTFFIFCNVITLAEIRTLCGHILEYHAITDCKQWISRHRDSLKTKIRHNAILHIDAETSGSADRLGDDFPKLQQRKFRIQS